MLKPTKKAIPRWPLRKRLPCTMHKSIMRKAAIAALLLIAAGLTFGASIFVTAVNQAAMAGDFKTANSILQMYRKQRGINPEYLQAYSWIGRGNLKAKNYQ